MMVLIEYKEVTYVHRKPGQEDDRQLTHGFHRIFGVCINCAWVDNIGQPMLSSAVTQGSKRPTLRSRKKIFDDWLTITIFSAECFTSEASKHPLTTTFSVKRFASQASKRLLTSDLLPQSKAYLRLTFNNDSLTSQRENYSSDSRCLFDVGNVSIDINFGSYFTPSFLNRGKWLEA